MAHDNGGGGAGWVLFGSALALAGLGLGVHYWDHQQAEKHRRGGAPPAPPAGPPPHPAGHAAGPAGAPHAPHIAAPAPSAAPATAPPSAPPSPAATPNASTPHASSGAHRKPG